MTADRLADWMRSNPDEIDAFMAHNRSYIFFRIIENISESDGPVGAARIPLIKGRSLGGRPIAAHIRCPYLGQNQRAVARSGKSFSPLNDRA